jgi:DNA topoisomerase-6 subunit B
MAKTLSKITTSSAAEYFSKNLQQVGFSSPTKAVLTTLKEAVDNSLDACEEAGILPEIRIRVEKLGEGSLRNTDRVLVRVEDNGPGLHPDDVGKVFGEYLASSKFGRGRCSRGQQGIGISAATTWAMQTAARGVAVCTKQARAEKAFRCSVDVDLKNNKGIVRDKKLVAWDRPHGTAVEFVLDGRIQLNGEAGLLSYVRGNILLNPHLTLHYKVGDAAEQTVARVSDASPQIPEATAPHPHTMKLGEFRAHAGLFGNARVGSWLKQAYSRVNDRVLLQLVEEEKLDVNLLDRQLDKLSEQDFHNLYACIQRAKLPPPSTQSVFALGEDALALSLQRLGELDFFSVVTRPPTIADFKPVQVEIAIARFKSRGSGESDEPVQVLRFANRVPLQFDKAACAIVKAIGDVNWRSYGLRHPRGGLPQGPYVVAVSVVSPFIKFKNASKETIDASDELVEELRRGLMKAGQRLSRYLNREHRADELERKTQHLEQFGPVLVETLARILGAPEKRKEKARVGLAKILESDTKGVRETLRKADETLSEFLAEKRKRLSQFFAQADAVEELAEEEARQLPLVDSVQAKPTPAKKETNAKAKPTPAKKETNSKSRTAKPAKSATTAKKIIAKAKAPTKRKQRR